MALSSAEHEPFFITTGTGKDRADTGDLAQATLAWADSKANGCKRYLSDPTLAPLVYQLQKMQDEIDYLRTEISANKDKATFPGFGTSGSTALAGNTTTITTDQANAITANTAKTTFPGLGTSSTTALAGDTKIVGYVRSSDTNITIGNMASATVKGQTTYTLPITVTQTGTDKLGNTTTLTKTATLTLA
jgi:hypothetical protein